MRRFESSQIVVICSVLLPYMATVTAWGQSTEARDIERAVREEYRVQLSGSALSAVELLFGDFLIIQGQPDDVTALGYVQRAYGAGETDAIALRDFARQSIARVNAYQREILEENCELFPKMGSSEEAIEQGIHRYVLVEEGAAELRAAIYDEMKTVFATDVIEKVASRIEQLRASTTFLVMDREGFLRDPRVDTLGFLLRSCE